MGIDTGRRNEVLGVHRRGGRGKRALFWGVAVTVAVALTAPSEAAAGSPVTSISSNCSGSDAWIAQMSINSDDPASGGGWRLDSPFSQPASGGYQPESQGFLVEQTVPLDQATVTLSAALSFEGGASGVVVSRLVDRPESCVLVAPPVGPADAPSADAPSADAPSADAPSADAGDQPTDAPVVDAAAAVSSPGVPGSSAIRVDDGAAADPPAATGEPVPEIAASQAAPSEASGSLAAAPVQNLPATGDEVTVLAVLGALTILVGLGLVRLGRTTG